MSFELTSNIIYDFSDTKANMTNTTLLSDLTHLSPSVADPKCIKGVQSIYAYIVHENFYRTRPFFYILCLQCALHHQRSKGTAGRPWDYLCSRVHELVSLKELLKFYHHY